MAATAAFLLLAVGGAQSADTFAVHLVSQDNNSITLGWSPQPGYGYLFSADGNLVSRTNDPNRSTVKFSKQYSMFDIDVITKGANGHYPDITPPPPPKAQCEDGVDNDGDGKIDLADPGCVSATDNDETDPAPPPAGASVYLSPNGNDAAACTATAPCRTVTRGYAAASSGDTVQMADGYYPCATLTGSKTVTFQAGSGKPWITCTSGRAHQDGVAVSLRLDNASNLTFDGIWMAGLANARKASSNITLRDVHITCLNDAAHFQLYSGQCTGSLEQGADNFSMTGGEIGPSLELANEGGGSHTFGNNTLFDDVTFHDNLPGNGHSELLLVWSGNPLTIKNSRFLRWGGTAAIYFSEFGTTGASNVLIENNFIGPTVAAQIYAIYIGTLTNAGGTRNFDLRYNTVYNGIYTDNQGQDGSTMVGNISAYVQCPGGFDKSYNLYGDDLGRTCGTNSSSVPSTAYTCSGCGFDTTGHLIASSPAIGKGNPGDFPALDIDGQTRPINQVDAGSDER